ncbi:MAG: membrane-bound lytic murein transglycosylase MltF [Thermodesulfobacteriota bacterium]
MKPFRRVTVIVFWVALAVAVAGIYDFRRSRQSLWRIREQGKIVLLTENNANSYYIYKDTPMGFEHDLAKAFADYLGVALEVRTPGWDRLFSSLEQKEGDFIAAGITRTRTRERRVAFSRSYLPVRQQLIVHKSDHSVKIPEDLAGRTVHVREDTTYQQRLEELQADGIDLKLELHRDTPTEELIEKVSRKEIEMTVADSTIALLNRRYYPDIRIAFPIEKEQHLAWAVRKNDRGLRHEINRFFDQIKENGIFTRIYNRYYTAVERFDYEDIRRFHQRLYSRLPQFRSLIERESDRYGLDWQMVAAVIYQESHFDPYAQSPTNAKGLMQLTQVTADEMGVTDRFDAEQNIAGGVAYLVKLIRRFDDIDDPRTRLLFALASYNIGYGHVRDAQQIALELGLDPTRWQSIKQTLPLLRNREYYERTTYGYARGTDPVYYVEQILTYYDILKQKKAI